MLTTARVIICCGLSTSANSEVPRYAASIMRINSFLRIPKIRSIPVIAGRPSQLTVTGLKSEEIAGIHPARSIA